MPDTRTHSALQARREEILNALATTTFTPEEYAAIYEELAEIALALGPDLEDLGEAKMYQDMREHLTHLSAAKGAVKNAEWMIDRERRRWHPKEDDHGYQP